MRAVFLDKDGTLIKDVPYNVDQSWFIGDILNDVEAGHSAGCRTILIDNGNETEWQMSPQRLPHYCVADITAAAQMIISPDKRGGYW